MPRRRKSLSGLEAFCHQDELHIGNLIFLSLANIKVTHASIVTSLMNRTSAVLERRDGSLCFPTNVLDIWAVEVCVGGVILQGRDPSEFEWQVSPIL